MYHVVNTPYKGVNNAIDWISVICILIENHTRIILMVLLALLLSDMTRTWPRILDLVSTRYSPKWNMSPIMSELFLFATCWRHIPAEFQNFLWRRWNPIGRVFHSVLLPIRRSTKLQCGSDNKVDSNMRIELLAFLLYPNIHIKTEVLIDSFCFSL